MYLYVDMKPLPLSRSNIQRTVVPLMFMFPIQIDVVTQEQHGLSLKSFYPKNVMAKTYMKRKHITPQFKNKMLYTISDGRFFHK